MDYQIISADERNGQIQVAYKSDGKLVGIYAVDVPIVDTRFVTGADLHTHIMHTAPVWAVEREQKVVAATNFAEIAALVQPLDPSDFTPADTDAEANTQMWEQVHFEKRVAQALLKFGVIDADPTEIGATKL